MIKHWEILENKWTQNSAYVLGIQGEDRDSEIILTELSSFCSLTDVKVSNFTHIFELLNVTDDDILQKIRNKIEEIIKRSSLNNKENSFSSVPLMVSNGSLDFEKEGEQISMTAQEEALQKTLPSSSDGNPINLNVKGSIHLEDTKTSKILSQEQEPEALEKGPEIKKPAEEKPKKTKEEPSTFEKEKKIGFLKRLFSFGKKKEEVKEEKPVSLGPLPIEQIAADDESTSKANFNLSSEKAENIDDTKEEKKPDSKRNRGIVIKGTAFPAQELGAQKIKDVSLDSKTIFEKEQETRRGEALQAQVPLDDIFAAETICQFYDDKNSSQQPKIEKIEEPTPMPTPRVITITQNKILEENLKQAEVKNQEVSMPDNENLEEQTLQEDSLQNQVKQEEKEEASSTEKKEKQAQTEAPLIPAAKIIKKDTVQKTAKEISPVKESKEEKKDKPQQPAVSENKKVETVKADITNQPSAKLDKKENAIPKITITEEEALAVKKAAEKENKTLDLQYQNSYKKGVDNQQKNKKQADVSQDKKQAAAKPQASSKPIIMPTIKGTQLDGFDHTIQTTSIPIYKKSNWPIEMPIVPSFTLDNMNMSSNRFAHAAAMSIVENPGTMHNPFFVFGDGGCGKTHFLNAIGVEFAKKISQDKIFITNGVRFSRGVQRAIENGTIDKVKDFLDKAQVLIIDDIHLTAVNETNREFISQTLNDYVAKRKQLIISSKYPPEGLSRFEELTNFKLSQGWISELKPLRPSHFLKAYVKMAIDAQIDLTEAQCRGFFGRENLTLGMIAQDIKRAKVLRRRIKDSGNVPVSYEQLLNYITAISGEDSTSRLESMNLTSPLSIRRGENTNWGNFGFFFPKESADKFKWIVYATMERAQELGIKGGFNFALKSAYSTEHIISSAFKIANVCDSKNLKAAIILGPDPKIIQPAIRDNFCDILSHMLEVIMIRCAIISYEDIKKPSSYVKVLGDVLK